MCVYYCGGVQYRRGVQYHGGYHKWEDILSTVGCSVPWGYHDKCGDFLSTVGGVQYCGHIMSTVGLS